MKSATIKPSCGAFISLCNIFKYFVLLYTVVVTCIIGLFLICEISLMICFTDIRNKKEGFMYNSKWFFNNDDGYKDGNKGNSALFNDILSKEILYLPWVSFIDFTDKNYSCYLARKKQYEKNQNDEFHTAILPGLLA